MVEKESVWWNVSLLLPRRQILKLLIAYVNGPHINLNFLWCRAKWVWMKVLHWFELVSITLSGTASSNCSFLGVDMSQIHCFYDIYRLIKCFSKSWNEAYLDYCCFFLPHLQKKKTFLNISDISTFYLNVYLMGLPTGLHSRGNNTWPPPFLGSLPP